MPELSDTALSATLTAQKAELDALIAGYGAAAVLRHGVDCVLLGRPNVGKSTLLNLLAGFDRAIVTPVAGTTRDVVEQAVQLGEIRLIYSTPPACAARTRPTPSRRGHPPQLEKTRRSRAGAGGV